MKRSFKNLTPPEVLALAMEIEKNNAQRFKVLAEFENNHVQSLDNSKPEK